MPSRRSGVCDVCQAPGTRFQHIYDDGLIALAESMGFRATNDYCDQCMTMLKARYRSLQEMETIRASTIESEDVSLPLNTQSQPREVPRLSEMPLAISPRPETTSSESMDDTVDRLVQKRPRVSKTTVENLASQSLSLDEASRSKEVSRRGPASPSRVLQRSSQSVSVSVSLNSPDHSQRAPPPAKKPRMRPTARQFATGTLELPLTVQAKILPGDMPRVISG